MSKTIKIIDLFNKIANGEELPKKIKYIGQEFILKFDNVNDIYFYETDTGLLLLKTIYNTNFLLDTVEIIEEQQDIDIQRIEEIKEIPVFLSVDTKKSIEENLKMIDEHEVNFFFKINEIIRKHNKLVKYLEQLDKNIKEK